MRLFIRRANAWLVSLLIVALSLPAPTLAADKRAITEMDRQESRRRFTPLSPLTTWTPIGPAPIPNGQTVSPTNPVSGRVTAIASFDDQSLLRKFRS